MELINKNNKIEDSIMGMAKLVMGKKYKITEIKS